MLTWRLVMLAIYKRNYRFFSSQKCNLSISRIVFIYDCAAYDDDYYKGRSFRQFSLIFLHESVSLKLTTTLIIGHFLTSVKFRGNIKILQKGQIPWLGSSAAHKKLGPTNRQRLAQDLMGLAHPCMHLSIQTGS